MTTADVNSDKKPLPQRSPSYPYCNLRVALEKAELIRVKENRNAARADVVVGHWGYSVKSSGGKQTMAALRSFGLLEGEGSVRLTEAALRVLLDTRTDSPDRDALIRQLALKPPMHQQLWERYGPDLPSDANLRHSLLFDYNFNPNTVDDFIREYKQTLQFAKLNESVRMPPEEEDSSENSSRSGGQMTNSAPTTPAPTPVRVQPPISSPVFSGDDLPPVTFPLPRGNALEIRLRSKVTAAEFQRLKPILMGLLEMSVVEDADAANPPLREEGGA